MRCSTLSARLLVLTLAGACTGQIDGDLGDPATEEERPAPRPGATPSSPTAGPAAPRPGAAGTLYAPDENGVDDGKLIRVSSRQYENMVADVLGLKVDLSQVLDPDSVGASGFRVGFDIAPSLAPRYLEAAGMIAAAAVDGGKVGPCMKTAPGTACTDSVIDSLVSRLWRRKLAPADRTALHDVVTKGMAAGEAAYGFWVYVLMHPYFLYVVEEPSADGLLDDHALAARLALVLWRSAPDAPLLAAAQAGALRKDDGMGVQVARMIAQPRARETLETFLADWAGLKALSQTSLDPKRHPGWSEQSAQSYQRSVQQLFREATTGDLVKTLLRASSYWSDDRILRLLGTAPRGAEGTFDFGDNRRGGLLTHPAFLTANSTPEGGDIIHRGVFVRRNVLCEPGLAVPEGLDTSLPDTAKPVTNRDRFDPILKRQPCGTCHSLFQPFGNAFETFDAAGAWRRTDAGVPIDPAGSVHLGLSDRDLAFADAVDLAGQLHDSPQTGACLTRWWFRYALSAPVSRAASASLQPTHQAFAGGGQTMESLARSFFTSNAFRRYTPPEN